MNFSIGNLLSIIIVLIVLIIYRQIDRSNRSLEKVKRFSDKIKDQLAQSVDDKSAEMKNLAIELQVNLKTGKELLKRVREAEDRLKGRAEGIDEIQKKIDGYDQAMEELVGMTARVDENLKRIQSESLFVDKVGKRIEGSAQRLQKMEQEISRVEESFRQQNQKAMAALRDEVTRSMSERVQEMTRGVEESEKRIKDFSVYVTRLESRGEEMQREVLGSLTKSFEQLELEAKSKRSGLLNQFVSSLNKLLAEADARGKSLKKGYSESLSSFEKKLEQTVKRAEAFEGKVFDHLKSMIAKDSADTTSQRQALRQKIEQMVGLRRDLSQQLGLLQKDAERFKGESLQKLSQAAEQMQVAALKSVEERLEEHQKEIDYKFQKLENANLDIEAMEKNLQQLIQKTGAQARAEFAGFLQSFAEERAAEQQKVRSEFADLHAEVQEIGVGLAELKSKAYDNVSEQLQVFEDDFFKDLRERSSIMEEKLQEWQGEIDARIKEVAAAQLTERQNLEKRFGEELKVCLERTKQESLSGLELLEGKVAEFESTVLERIGGSEEYLEGFKTSLSTQLERTRKETQDRLEKQIQALKGSVDGKVKEVVQEVEERLRAMEGAVSRGRSELEETIDKVRSELVSWQARVNQALKNHEVELTEKFSGLRRLSEEQIAAIREHFAEHSDELVAASNTERLQMKEELESLGQRIEELDQNLVESSEAALESFKRQVEAFQAEMTQRSKDLQVDMDGRVRDMRQRLSEMKEKSEAQQQSLVARIEEGYQLLNINLNDMDKRVKVFVNQTRIYERADDLKVSLETRVEEMKREIEKLQGARKEMEDMESRVLGMKKTTDEISGKLGKLLSEKGRIEDMDSDFKKLLNISKELDHRIRSVYTSQDALQEIQAKIRELENLEKATEGRFDRLDKKKAIIEATTAAVDKNFQTLDQLEKNIGVLGKDFTGFSARLEVFRQQTEQLAANKEKSDYVVQKIQDLDSILGDLEERMEKLEKAREWLAKTETRFETVGKQAQEQVRLMESILKADKKQAKLGEGAPPLDKRETVIKLAHLGWTPAEIARTTRLSRGEVELILELAPNK